MAIDKSGDWWTGTEHSDLAEYLREYQAGGYKIHEVATSMCGSCSSDEGFRVRVDPDEGFVERTCTSCGVKFVLLDGTEIAPGVNPRALRCPCGGRAFDVAVGFSLRKHDVRWVSLGIRCRKDGVLGSPADWKIDYSPSAHLVNAV